MSTAGMKWNVARGISILALAAGSGFASPILVSNFSFETAPVGGLASSCGPGCTYSVGPIPSWMSTGIDFGQFRPSSANFTTLSNGTTSAYSNAGTISQTVLPTVQLGDLYTLQVDIGYRLDTPFAGSAALLIGTTPILALGTTPTRGTFGTYIATYTGTAADVGKTITVELISSGAQGNFDNVRLDVLAPEPVSYLLLGSALLVLAGFGRRRANLKTRA